MPRPTKVTRLPADIRELIGQLRRDGRTLDEILGKLRELDVGVARSTLAEHIAKLEEIGAQMHADRALSEALVARFGDAPESKTARLNIEMLQGLIMQAQRAMLKDGADPKKINSLSDSLYRLARASKDDVEREAKLRAIIEKEIADKAKTALKAVEAEAAGDPKLGLSDVLKRIRRDVYGIAE